MRNTLLALLVLIVIGGAAGAQFMMDDYNGYTGSTLGLWKEYAGNWNAVNGTAEAGQVKLYQYLVWENPRNDLKFKDCVAECQVMYNPKSIVKLQFGGVALRIGNAAGGTDMIHVKVQDNNSNGDFDTIWLYERPGSAASKQGVTGFKTALVRLTCLDQNAVAEIDVNGDGLWDHVINKKLAIVAKSAHVGLCAYGGAQMDNFKVFNAVMALAPTNPSPQPGQVLSYVLRGTPKAAYQAATAFTTGTVAAPGGANVPLAPDALFFLSIAGLPSVFVNYANYLDTKGDGSVKLAIPKIPALVGITFYSAFVTYNTSGVLEVSNDVQVTVVK